MEMRRRVDLRGVDLGLDLPTVGSLRNRPVVTAVSALTRTVRHRATTSTGAVVDDPSSADLAALVAEVGRSGRDSFVIVERRADRSAQRSGEYYLQAVRDGAGWVVEVRAGGVDRHFRAVVADAAEVIDAFSSWIENSKRWHGLAWQHVPRQSSWQQNAAV